MRLRLRLFGCTVCSFTLDVGPALEILEEGITGGTGLYTERDLEPPIPEERHNHEYDRGFGFT